MKLEKYNRGSIGKAARSSLFLSSPAMLMALGCEKVGHELCEQCGEALEIWKTAKSRYMPLSPLQGELYNTRDLIMYKLHWHHTDKQISVLDKKREKQAWQEMRQRYKAHLRRAAGFDGKCSEQPLDGSG